MSGAIKVDPRVGDTLCKALEAMHGIRVDIILIVAPSPATTENWRHPSFVTSLHPDVMETVMIQLGQQMEDSAGGKRIITGKHEEE